MMPKIWLVNQFANTPELAGHTRQYDISKFLVENGWDVEVFASDFNLSERCYKKLKRFQYSRIEFPAGIKWHWLWASSYKRNNWKRYLNLLSFSIHLFFKLNYLFLSKFKNPDIIIASSPQLPAAYICLLIAKLFKKPFVLEVRDLWPQVLMEQSNNKKYNFFIKILSFMERKVYEGAEVVVVLAKGVSDYVIKRGAKKTIWLPNGPDLKLFRKIPLMPEEKMFSFKRPFNLLYAGAHGDANNLTNIIKAARILCDYPIKFVFVGNGPEKNNLMEQSKKFNNVFFEEPVPKSEIPNLISKFDAIIVSLRDIPLFRYGVSPNKLYDAYAIGRPVVTTINGAINDEVEAYKLGVTAPSEDPQKLALSIKKLFFMSRLERIKISERARKIAEDVYSRERINQKYDQLLKKFL